MSLLEDLDYTYAPNRCYLKQLGYQGVEITKGSAKVPFKLNKMSGKEIKISGEAPKTLHIMPQVYIAN